MQGVLKYAQCWIRGGWEESVANVNCAISICEVNNEQVEV